MKSCLVHVVLILWCTSISSLCWNAYALNYGTDCLRCNISGGDLQSMCIPPTENNQLNIIKEQELNFTCRWTFVQSNNQYGWNISAPQGWRILLKVNSQRNLTFVAGNRNIKGSENASFNSSEDLSFHGVDEFLSITNTIWIEASINPARRSGGESGFNETFDIVARTVKVKDAVDTQSDGCDFRRMHDWKNAEYDGSEQSNGSFFILCNKTTFLQQSDIFISISYYLELGIFPANGLLQFAYVKPRNLMSRTTQNLYIKFNFSHCDSFRIRFDASGRMKLNISKVTVQGLMYNDDATEPLCITNTSSSTTLLSSTSHDYTSSSSLSPSSTSTTAEGNTSFTQANMTTWFSDMITMTTERTAADSLPIFLIPTVSVLAFFLLVFLAVLCICLRKRCHTKQSRGRESAPLDDPAFSNNEQHEYCEVRPSVKSPPDKTASGGHKNYAFVVTGPAMVMADEETVHSDDKTAKVKTPTANNKVLSNGPVYTLVDMEKKALDREEKADKARNRGNECVCNVDRAYATVELDEAFGDKGGQTEGKELNSSSMKPAPRSSSIKKDNSGAPMNQYEQMQLSDKGITDIHKTPECHTNHDEPELLGTSPTEPYDVLQLGFKSSVSSNFSKGDIQTKGHSSDDLEHAYQIVSGPSSSGVSSRPDSYPLGDYETVTVSPPVSPKASAILRPDSYPLSDYETVSPPMSPVAMASEQERPYDTLQRGPDIRKQTATSPTASTVDKKAKEEADHEDAFNVYNEIATPDVALSEEGSKAYQHLQRPLSKRPKAGAPLPEIPDEGYGRLDLEGFGASNQTDSQGPKTTQVDPMYAILEKPAEENVPDDDDPEYDLLDACM